MDATTLILIALGMLGSACAGAVVVALARRKQTVTDDLPDVVELAHELASLKKQVRRAYMQSVRAGESGPSQHPLAVQAPPELQTHESPPTASREELKQRIREAAFFPTKGRH